MRHIPEIFAPVVLLVLLQGCFRVDPTDTLSDGISFAPDVASTKALLNADGLAHSGTKIQVYDYITGFDGTIGGNTVTSGQTVKYFSDRITYNNAAIWPYCNPSTGDPDATIAYPWTKTGTHMFFGWLTEDGTTSGLTVTDLFGSGQPTFNESTRVLSIPQKEMTTTTAQFDFSYSGVVSIAAASHTTGTPVPLQLHHLFSAMGLTILNTSGNTILLKSVTLTGMKNKRSATISFNAATPAVTTDNVASTNVVLFQSANQAGDTYIHEDQVKDLHDFMLMWPQTYAELDGAQLVVEYNVVDSNEQVSDDLTASVVLNQQTVFKSESKGMEAGTKYSFMLQFKKSTIDIYVRVLPWEYDEYDWDYSNHSISARGGTFKDGVLAFYRGTGENASEPTTDEWSAKSMRFTSRNEVMTGRFYIEAPTSGRWQITPYPVTAAQYFIVSPTSDEIDVNTDNGKAEFTVRVNPDLSPGSTQTLYFNVAVYFNGEWHDANSEFNRKNIKLVLDAN